MVVRSRRRRHRAPPTSRPPPAATAGGVQRRRRTDPRRPASGRSGSSAMEWVETTGKTIEEAKEAALDQLGVHEDDAEVEVLEAPRVGLFGRMRGEARVRARVRPTRPRPKAERRDRKRRKPESPGRGDAAGDDAKPQAARSGAASSEAG